MRSSQLNIIAFSPEHHKWVQNPKFTPLSKMTSIPSPFICGAPPPSNWRTLALYLPPHCLSYLETRETQRYLERWSVRVLLVYLFNQQTTVEVPGLKAGMKLEAVDRNNPPSFCVATVIQKVGQRVCIRYDGFGKDSSNDHWCNFQAEELHPIGWCAQNGYPLQPPKG